VERGPATECAQPVRARNPALQESPNPFPHQIRDRLRHISSRGLEEKSMVGSMANAKRFVQIVGIRLAARNAIK
jgi:hypothetical protein